MNDRDFFYALSSRSQYYDFARGSVKTAGAARAAYYGAGVSGVAQEKPLAGGEREIIKSTAMGGAGLGGAIGTFLGAERGYTQRGGYLPKRLKRTLSKDARKALKLRHTARGTLKGAGKGALIGTGLGALAGVGLGALHAHTLRKMHKTASIGKAIAKRPGLAGAAIGGLALTAIQAIANRGGKNGSPSTQQRVAETLMHKAKRDIQVAKQEGRKLTYGEEINRLTAPSIKGLSDLAAKHPIRSALPALPIGASVGANIGRMLARRH